MKKTGFLIILILGLCVTPAHADISSGSYYAVEYGKLDAEVILPDITSPTGTRKLKPGLDNVLFKLGHYLANFLAVEMHVGTSLTEENGNGTSTFQATNLVSGFVRFNMPLHAHNTNVYILLGGTRTEIDVTDNFLVSATNLAGKVKATTTGGSYIFGVELYSTPTSALSLEYARYHIEDEVKYGGLTIGYVNHFSFSNMFK